MRILYKIERIIYNVELTAIVTLLLALSVFAFGQVVMRNMFSYSIIWMATFNNIALLVLAMLGASIATSSFERSHINIDLFQGILPFPYNKYLNALLTLIASAACVLFVYLAMHYVMVTKHVGKIEEAVHLPEWVITMIFPVCFCSMAYKFFICFLRDLVDIKDKINSNRIDADK
ncbi:MAG: TRAP transporter small permease subunit [Thermodesulfobacteriota bacterium]|nr:TRAP transporter small permease subunit [Thermodesulfobacteriota bacterium]